MVQSSAAIVNQLTQTFHRVPSYKHHWITKTIKPTANRSYHIIMTSIPFHQRLSSVNLDQRPSENSAILTETNPQLLLGTFWLRQSLLSSDDTALSIGATSCWSYPQADISYTYLRTKYILYSFTHNISHTHLHTTNFTLNVTVCLYHCNCKCIG